MARVQLIRAALVAALLSFPAHAQLGPRPVGPSVNTQTGTTYTVLNSDCGKLVTFSNASSVAVTLPQAGAASTFATGCEIRFANRGAGTVTVTPTISTIDGQSSVAIASGGGFTVNSSGGQWYSYGRGAASPSSGTVTSVTFTGDGTVLSSTPSSAVTSSGTVTGSLNTQSANRVLAGPTSGGAVAPTFRALVAGDLPTGTTSSSSTIPLNNSTRLNYATMSVDIGTVATATSTASPSAKVVFGLTAGTYEIPASTTPRASCGTNPGGTMTLVWKKNGSTTLCTMSLSTSCAVSACSIANTSFADGDYLTVESTADATVTGLAFGVPLQKKD